MKIGYARVSAHEQLHDLQIDSLKAAGCERIYTDTCSGSVPGGERPELQNALASARTGDTLVVWRLDRLGRSLQDLIRQINGLAEREVQFISLQEDLNTATPAGRLTFHFCGALAEFERDLIRERTRAGLAAARARGRKGGRKRKVNDRMLARAAELMRDRTVGIKEICRIVGVGKTTLYRYLTPDGQRRGEKLPDAGSVNHAPHREETVMQETTTTTRHQKPDGRERSQDLAARFHELADRWEDESMFLSNSGHARALPSYGAIVKLGDQVVPLILKRMQTRGGHWYHALHDITQENPVAPDDRGNVAAMQAAWLRWGRDHGSI